MGRLATLLTQRQKPRKGEPFNVRFTLSTDRVVQDEARRTRRSKSAVVESLTEEAVRTLTATAIPTRSPMRSPRIVLLQSSGASFIHLSTSRPRDKRHLRLLLDANLSLGGVAAPLRRRGHDVLALAEDASYEGLPDPQVLELATREHRILVTRNSRHFAPLARQWAEGQRAHGGLILIWTLDHSQFAAIVAGIERRLVERPTPELWQGITVAL